MIKRLMFFTFFTCLWLGGMNITTVFVSALVTLCVAYIVAPLTFHYSPTIQRHLVFLPYVNYPRKVKFYEPENEGLPATRNFYIETEKGVRVGVWHVLPQCLMSEVPKKGLPGYDEWYIKSLSDHRPVLLYLHGNTSSRAISHRVELYNVLRKLDWHVVAFDYRGYADSTNVTLNETGVVHDARVVYNHIRDLIGSSPFIIWGHSLGTGVSSHAIASLCLEGKSPDALVLESPFNNIRDEVKYHPLTAIFRKMPKFEWLFLKPLKKTGIDFKSDEHIANIDIPVLILHAKDDLVVPFMLGKRLYETALKVRKNLPPIKFVEFESNFGYGHKFICRAPTLPNLLLNFLDEIRDNKKK